MSLSRSVWFAPIALLAVVALALAGFAAPARAQSGDEGPPAYSDAIPRGTDDLADVLAKIEAIKALAKNCQEMECPVLNCATAMDLLAGVTSTETILEHLVKWLQAAAADHRKHFESLVEQGVITTDNMARAQEALAWQEYLHNLSNAINDIASLSSFFEDIAAGKLENKSFEDFVDNVNRFDSALRALESGSTTVAGGMSGSEFEKVYTDLRPSPSELSMLQSTAFGLKDAVRDAQEAMAQGKRWTEGLKKPNGAGKTALGLIHSGLSMYSDSLIRERRQHIQNLANDLASSDVVQSKSYQALANVQARRNLAEDALAAIEGLDRELIACMRKANCGVGSMTQVLIEDFIDRGPQGQEIPSWGRALRFLQTALNNERPRLGRLPSLEDICPETPTDTENYTSGFMSDASDLLIHIGTDNPTYCLHRDGNPTGTPLTPMGPGNGDDPRDVAPPPGGGAPPDDGGDPRDVSPPRGGDPRDADPCDELESLLERSEEIIEGLQLDRLGGRTGAALTELQEIHERIPELRKKCPGSEDPRDAGEPPAQQNPCDELDDLLEEVERVRQDLTTGQMSGGVRESAINNLPNIYSRIAELRKECPGSEDPRDVPTTPPNETEEPPVISVTIFIKAKSSVISGAEPAAQSVAGQQVKLFPTSTADVALPGAGVPKPQTDHDQDPIQGTTDANGDLRIDAPASALGLTGTPFAAGGQATPAFAVNVDITQQGSLNIQFGGTNLAGARGALPEALIGFVTDGLVVGNSSFVTLTFPLAQQTMVNQLVASVPGVVTVEVNFCRSKQEDVDDPYFQGAGSWGQRYDDQWGMKRVGFTKEADSAWNLVGDSPEPVTVAVIDTGLDWNHLDFGWENLWKNDDEIPDNDVDDDQNGYVDDVIGWDFYGRHNKPWDHDGHGTFVAGLIAASSNNDIGIAGINPAARIMVLKALNTFGHSRASYLAKAIVYAADNGARIINMSVGGKSVSRIEREAIDYAVSKDVLVIVAAGNEGINVGDYGTASMDGVVTVAATDLADERTVFSNWGPPVDIAAPGVDILSLRARRTDTMLDIPDVAYEAGGAYVGEDRRYYRASGTSFSAPLVAGVASLLLSKDPSLTREQLTRMLLHSARDIDTAGVDQYSGYGLLDARAALAADPSFFIESVITGVEVVQSASGPAVRVLGTSNADEFGTAVVEIGAGEEPTSWTPVGELRAPAAGGALIEVDANAFRGSSVWILRLVTKHDNGRTREARFRLSLG